ncbi:GTPase IMAP family member 4-like [Megalops cyprinoides]|uniref:GTPase IMAP family member 4-like n=1 Tax=Megalops cyprinoides TaxID=118141 RepID=UPI001864B758|nr:GTPase IMAP family member 4-like [Megalops cyprinoides]
MECDCKPDSACTSTSQCGDKTDLESAVEDLWINFNSLLTGALTVLGYLLYKFSQALPAIIRWPIRIFCSLTGLSSLWSWVSRLLSTVRGIQTLLKWLSSLWKVIAALPSKLSWVPVVIKAIAGSLTNVKKCLEAVTNLIQYLRGLSKSKSLQTTHSPSPSTFTSDPSNPRLRLILVGPPGGGRSSLGDTLLSCSGGLPRVLRQSASQRTIVEGREVTVVDTPDLLGSSLGAAERAREALRSIQLASPGPHAFLLVMPAPGLSDECNISEIQALRALLALVGEGALNHVLPVLTHADSVGSPCTLAHLLQVAPEGLRATLSLCSQRAEIVDNSPACSPSKKRALARRVLERVLEMRELGGHYRHELQRREDRIREELLEDMVAVLESSLKEREKEEERRGEQWQ